MLDLEQVGDLLVLNATLDRFATASKQTADRLVAWHAVIKTAAPSMTFDEARTAVIEYYADAGESLTPHALIQQWKTANRLHPQQIAGDVRSARARGLISAAWDERDPLPPDVAGRLRAARVAENRQAIEHAPGATRAITE